MGKAVDVKDTIPKDVAWELCKEIRQKNQGKWYTFGGVWCWGCSTFCKGDLEKMCVSNKPGYRGCGQVNTRYDKQVSELE